MLVCALVFSRVFPSVLYVIEQVTNDAVLEI